jgi:hypothetical protein|eukprot:COSAG01_NODE_1518_length_10043_cov_99.027951_8_plen_42_part_00
MQRGVLGREVPGLQRLGARACTHTPPAGRPAGARMGLACGK